MERDSTLAALRAACASTGLDATSAKIIHHSSNAVYLLPAAPAVARVTSGPDASVRVQRVVDLVRWLKESHALPVTSPFPGVPPVAVTPRVAVSFWVHYDEQDTAPSPTSRDLASLLRRLHDAPSPIREPPPWVPLQSLADVLSDASSTADLSLDDREWLNRRLQEIRVKIGHLTWPLGTGLIHGDAWAGNLLWSGATCRSEPSTEGPHSDRPYVLGDWDWTSVGPREVDLIPTWHAARRYGRGPEWTRHFVDSYGYDISRWDGFETLMDMRDLVQLTGPIRRSTDSLYHRQVLRQRLDSLQAGDTTTVWSSVSPGTKA
jgi:aminoglycoside phosphotransferase (APT) family kinase protein